MNLHCRREFVLVVTALLVSVGLLYPGLWGGFHLDDHPNLQNLSSISEQGFWNYVLAGVAGGAGRSISYFSFALQASSWPDNPFAFKLVNLVIHLLNITLVYVLVRQLMLQKQDKLQPGSIVVPVLIAALWGMHPLQSSSVFYVVQRMTLLSSTFVLLSCCLYLWVRNTPIQNSLKKYCLLTVAVGLGYTGILAKEGAVLTGLFICLLEWFSRRQNAEMPRISNGWLAVFCVAPIIVLFIYLGIQGHYTSGYGGRNFTLTERLLTEPRVLWDYVGRILLPTASSINFYNDDVVVSRSLFSPISTGWAILAWLLVLAVSLAFRKKAPLVFFGVFWFLVGHLLESTVLPLEISFEHRNYVPLLGWLLVAVGGLASLLDWMTRKGLVANARALRLGGGAVIVFWVINLVAVSRVEALTWGDPWKFGVAGVVERPQSLRARQGMADVLSARGNYREAAALLWRTDKELGPITGIYLQMELLRCFDSSVDMPTPGDIKERLLTGPRDLSVDTLEQIWTVKTAGGCQMLSWDQYREYLQLLEMNPSYQSFFHSFIRLRAYSFNSEERFQEAALEMERLPEERVNVGYVIIKARFLGIAGRYDEALATIERLKARLHRNELKYGKALQFVNQLEQEIKARMVETAVSEGGRA